MLTLDRRIELTNRLCYLFVIFLIGCLTGWMLKKYLVTGAKMDQVTPCFSQQTLRDDKAETETPIYTDLSLKERYCTHSGWALMGVVNGWLYVVVTDEGETGYAPMEWFFDGNG